MGALFSQPPPPDPQIIVPGPPRALNNNPKAIWDHSGKNPKNPPGPDPTQPKSLFFPPMFGMMAGFRPRQVLGLEKSCQAMPSKSHLEPRGSKSVTKTRFLKVPNSGRIPGLACLAGLGLLGFPRLASASLALPAPRNNSPAAGAPLLLLLLVQARRARPIRGQAAQESEGLKSKPSKGYG